MPTAVTMTTVGYGNLIPEGLPANLIAAVEGFLGLSGFAVAVLFYSLGSAPAGDSLLSQAAHLPGDPFERVAPWLLPMLILWFFTQRRGPVSAARST